jgi:hypothetical protein
MDNLQGLKDKLKEYRQKYYQSQLMKGGLYAFGLGLSLFLTVALLEYLGRFNSQWRLVLLLVLALGLLFLVGRFLVYPLLQWAGFGKVISNEQAARLLAKHFKNVDDKIIGALQLGQSNPKENRLAQEAVKQRVAQLQSLPFTTAVNFKDNLKYAPLFLVPALIFLALFISEGGKEVLNSTSRVLRYTESFEEPAPFNFKWLNPQTKVREGEKITLSLSLQGDAIPAKAELLWNGQPLRMIKDKPGAFSLEMETLQKDVIFRFRAGGFESKPYRVEVLPVPRAKNIVVQIQPPGYTALAPQTIGHKPNIQVPVGSTVIWQVQTEPGTEAIWETEKEELKLAQGKLAKVINSDQKYQLYVQNAFLKEPVVAVSTIRVLPDAYPSIKADWLVDTSRGQLLLYNVTLADDYGVSKVTRTIRVGKEVYTQAMEAKPQLSGVLNLDTFTVSQQKRLEVYFTVFDNDAVNGAKKTESNRFRKTLLTEEEKEERRLQNLRNASKAAAEQLKRRENFNQQVKALEQNLRGQKKLEWKDKQKLEDLLKDLEALQKQEKQRKKRLKKALEQSPKLEETKRERLKELSEEEKKLEQLKKEIEQLLNKLDKEGLQEKLKQLQEENNKAARKEERSKKTLEDLLFQRDLLRKAEQLEQLSKELAEQSKQEEPKAQEKLADQKKELNEIKKDLQELGKKNRELEQTLASEEFKKAQDKTDSELSKAQEQQQQGKQEQSKQSQEKASEGAQEMSEQLMQSMQSMMQKQLELNMKSLRQILENLEIYSRDVEASGETIKELTQGDPRYRAMLKEENRLTDGAQVIRDSLTLLAEKAPQVKEMVFTELEKMESSLADAKAQLQEQATGRASAKHQFSMMAANELALMLEQSMQQMQQMMAQQKKGKQNCQKPGGAKPKPGAMGKKMSELGKKIERLKKGKKQGKGKGVNGKELVQILAEQEQLRQQLEELSKEEGAQGNKGNKLKVLEELDKIEEDLLNNKLEDNFVERYQRVETRLLEDERAELERKTKEERESEKASDLEQIENEALQKYLREKGITKEQLIQDDLRLTEFYQSILKAN